MSAETPAAPVLAKWRELSGLTVEAEKSLQGKDRRAAIRKLFAAAESEIRAELKLAEEDAEFKTERTFLWEPIPAVCRSLEITQTQLTRLLKELTGMTATQLADKIRVEGLREKLRADLVQHVKDGPVKPGNQWFGRDDYRNLFWENLKAWRASPAFSLAARAIELGFANYTRLYRACLLKYGKTPTQLENEILREIAEFFTCAKDLSHRREADRHLNKMDPRYDRYRKPYADNWAEAAETRPEWLTKNRELFGLNKELQQWL